MQLMNVAEASESSVHDMDQSKSVICGAEGEAFESTQKIKMTESAEKMDHSYNDNLGQTLLQPLTEIALFTNFSGKN